MGGNVSGVCNVFRLELQLTQVLAGDVFHILRCWQTPVFYAGRGPDLRELFHRRRWECVGAVTRCEVVVSRGLAFGRLPAVFE